MKLANRKVKDFLVELAAKKAAPGGGSASALSGAMAAALVVMVAEFTIGKEKYSKQEEKIKKIREQSREKLAELTELIEKDAQAYQEVVKTKGSQSAVKKAAEVPLQTAEKSLEVLKMANFVADKGNQNLRSDAFCAVGLATAAVHGALENVRINLPCLEDKALANQLKDKIERILSGADSLVKPLQL